MDRIGISFYSPRSPDQVREWLVRPLRKALEDARGGIFSNYLHQDQEGADQAAEHLLVFEVNDFEGSLRVLRTELEKLDAPREVLFHNLNPSDLPY
ncbi:hypothetical protein [Adhaeretor mobilis]|uniref:Uncharacterized protein n=1 Tax=Adhaeretor mobilis TaxID=1930276 RepID=A0A517MQW1_9BACT|nr:hypothetical protein [Adhaeretor mobilis]QDS97273.1 hypothetical protein HG15A2_05340 [Adhaeretor mobilis]